MHTATASPSTARLTHVPAGEGRSIWNVGDTYTFKVTGADTENRLVVWEAVIPPGAGPPPHLHREQDEAYYLLEGELEVLDGDRTFTASAGAFVYIPRGAVHRFKNVSDRPSRMLIWMAPAGFEEFLIATGTPARPGEPAPLFGPEDLARAAALAPHYGLELRLSGESSSPADREEAPALR